LSGEAVNLSLVAILHPDLFIQSLIRLAKSTITLLSQFGSQMRDLVFRKLELSLREP
jgi:hypothetical protein